MSDRTGFGWENYDASKHELKHGMVLMIDEVDLAYVVENTFGSATVEEYQYTNLEFPISADGTYFDSVGEPLRKITAVKDEGWMNEPQVERNVD